jgi:surfeit locus 1 family protein
VPYPTLDDLRCLYGESLAAGVLLMSPDAPGGFVREWTSGPELSPSKHYGYAAQWSTFTLVLIVLFVKFSFRPVP